VLPIGESAKDGGFTMTADATQPYAPGRHARRSTDVPGHHVYAPHDAALRTPGAARLLTPDALGETLGGLTGDDVLRLAKRHGWPHVRFSPKAVRFRPEDVEEIVALHLVTPLSQPSAQLVEFPAQHALPRQRHH